MSASLVLGSVTVAANGTVTKSGICEVYYDLMLAQAQAALARAKASTHPTTPYMNWPTGAAAVPSLQPIADAATLYATALFNVLTGTSLPVSTGPALVQIPADSTADGLQNGTTHPVSAKTLKIA